MLALTAMSSFSDAHETPDIPLIAADLNRLVWSAQKQIWAVLRRADSRQRLSYSLASTFLGRMCLSGDFLDLDETARRLVAEAIVFYREVAPIIRDGTFRCVREGNDSRQRPSGHQIVAVHDEAKGKLLVVWHRFEGAAREMKMTLPGAGRWAIARELNGVDATAVHCSGKNIRWLATPAWSGGVVYLKPA